MLRAPEGYLHYAVYPECYGAAAQSLAMPVAGVIGIRSIGTGLAAMVAAASGGAVALTLRPRGEPFRRRIAADPAMAEDLRRASGAIAVVDEGPGLSGSSFMAVIDWLEQAGVPPHRIHLFPSHDGPPGPQASDDTARRWPRHARHVVPFDRLFLVAPAIPRTGWLAGSSRSSVRSTARSRISPPALGGARSWAAGALAARHPGDGAPQIPGPRRRPPGAGQISRPRSARRAQAGYGAGARRGRLHGEPLALLHGFLVEDWLPAAPHRRLEQLPRPALVARLADYLGFRARAFSGRRG